MGKDTQRLFRNGIEQSTSRGGQLAVAAQKTQSESFKSQVIGKNR